LLRPVPGKGGPDLCLSCQRMLKGHGLCHLTNPAADRPSLERPPASPLNFAQR
jgi:hypothetical protein